MVPNKMVPNIMVPNKYTKGLSLKDKTKQKKNIKTAKRSYKQGKYVSRPKLKSFKKKRVDGQLNFIKDILKQKQFHKLLERLVYLQKH